MTALHTPNEARATLSAKEDGPRGADGGRKEGRKEGHGGKEERKGGGGGAEIPFKEGEDGKKVAGVTEGRRKIEERD